MPKNVSVVDVKPQNEIAIDILPRNTFTIDILPKANVSDSQSMDQLYNQILTAGMYTGIPGITYAETGTVQSPFSP